eukprot:TRINITY_DN12508_c1_g1_i1.p1 TRINITY_DN12508_c1_g1~~TRINITY_DN12508_c1_g1_i1.p1  ORF type:complete len:524 (+),score=115.84 TRINITY_DN12508_c1_g1_i1:2-1573(+)
MLRAANQAAGISGVDDTSALQAITAVRRPKLREVFDAIDADKNGSIGLEELMAMGRCLHEGSSEVVWDDEANEEAFHALDANSDGQIEFDEYCEFYALLFDSANKSDVEFERGHETMLRAANQAAGISGVDDTSALQAITAVRRPKLREVFDAIDADKNGSIGLEELMAMGRCLHEGSSEVVWDDEANEEAFHALDANSDGQIEFDEYCEFYALLFDSANKSDVEFERGHETMLRAANQVAASTVPVDDADSLIGTVLLMRLPEKKFVSVQALIGDQAVMSAAQAQELGWRVDSSETSGWCKTANNKLIRLECDVVPTSCVLQVPAELATNVILGPKPRVVVALAPVAKGSSGATQAASSTSSGRDGLKDELELLHSELSATRSEVESRKRQLETSLARSRSGSPSASTQPAPRVPALSLTATQTDQRPNQSAKGPSSSRFFGKSRQELEAELSSAKSRRASLQPSSQVRRANQLHPQVPKLNLVQSASPTASASSTPRSARSAGGYIMHSRSPSTDSQILTP